MNKKIIILFLLIILIITNLNSIEKKNIKAFEFSIGLGLENSLNYKYQDKYVTLQKDNDDVVYDENEINHIISFGTHIFIPVSFVFYLKNNFGIGLKIQDGILLLTPNYRYSNISSLNYAFWISGGLVNELLMVNKFGDYFDKTLLLEYGLSTLFSSYSSRGIVEFLMGPKTMVGFEKRYQNGFDYSIGGVFASYFQLYPGNITYDRSFLHILTNRNSYYNTTYINNFSVHILVGVEARIKFSFIKEFN